MGIKRNYLGDVKWVLYQYICDLNSETIVIRCGNFALSKLMSMAGVVSTNSPVLSMNLNGEKVILCHVPELEKKQVIISPANKDIEQSLECGYKLDTNVFPNDVVLYFA